MTNDAGLGIEEGASTQHRQRNGQGEAIAPFHAEIPKDGGRNDPPEREGRHAVAHGHGVAAQVLHESPKGRQHDAAGHLPDENHRADDGKAERILQPVGLDGLRANRRFAIDVFHLRPVRCRGELRLMTDGTPHLSYGRRVVAAATVIVVGGVGIAWSFSTTDRWHVLHFLVRDAGRGSAHLHAGFSSSVGHYGLFHYVVASMSITGSSRNLFLVLDKLIKNDGGTTKAIAATPDENEHEIYSTNEKRRGDNPKGTQRSPARETKGAAASSVEYR